LPASAAEFRQRLSLDTGFTLAVPDLRQAPPMLIGPITDLLTFYSDLQLALRKNLISPGDHAYVEFGKPSSWADGTRVLLGEDSIDFDLTLKSVNSGDGTA